MKLTYTINPLCSWCYGLNWLISPLYQRSASHLQVFFLPADPLMKSMLLGSPELAVFVQRQDQQVQRLTGAPFSRDRYRLLLSKSEYAFDSELAVRAVMTMQRLDPEHVFSFVVAMQEAHFQHGYDLCAWQTYRELLVNFSPSTEMFLYLWQSQEEIEQERHTVPLSLQSAVSLLDHRTHGDASMLSPCALEMLTQSIKRHLEDEGVSMPA